MTLEEFEQAVLQAQNERGTRWGGYVEWIKVWPAYPRAFACEVGYGNDEIGHFDLVIDHWPLEYRELHSHYAGCKLWSLRCEALGTLERDTLPELLEAFERMAATEDEA